MLTKIILLLPLAICFGSPITEEQLQSLIQQLLDTNQNPKATADSLPSVASMAAAASPINTFNTDIPQISPANQQMAQLNLAGGLTNLIKGALGSLKPKAESPAPVDQLLAGLFPNTGAVQPQSAPSPANPILAGLFPNTGAVHPQSATSPANPILAGLFPNTGAVHPQSAPSPANPILAGLFPNTGAVHPQSAPSPANSILAGLFPNSGAVQPAPAPAPSQRTNMFNPLSLLFPGSGGGSPFGMLMPGMMMRMMENLLELF